MKRAILLADDSPTIQRLVAQTFADGEFEVISVSNGDAAVKKFEDLRPHLVLADVYMPGRNGYEVCAYVKKHPELSDTPVVLLAGAFDAFDADTARQAGAAAHITKPFEPQALVDLVVSLLPAQSKAQAAAAAPATAAAPASAPVQPHTATVDTTVEAPAEVVDHHAEAASDEDLFGLGDLFRPAVVEAEPVTSLGEAEIELIVDRVIQKLSTQVIEHVAWDVVPDIATKVLREELKRQG